MTLKVACAQFAPEKAELIINLDQIADLIRQSVALSVDLLVFPETSTTGYFLEGGVLEASLTTEQLVDEIRARIPSTERPIDVAIGFYQNADGNLHNSCAYLELSDHYLKVAHVYRKFFLPTYGVFDEERFVSRGRELGVFDSRLGRIAILICEDVWHSVLPALCAVSGAQIVLVPSASPARGFCGPQIENLSRYERLMRALCEEHSVFGLNVQLCGFEGGKGFVGGSMVVDPMGQIIAQSPVSEPHLLVTDIDLDLIATARAQSPLLSDLSSAWADIRRLTQQVDI